MVKEYTGRTTIELPQHHRYKCEFGLPLQLVEEHLAAPAQGDFFEAEHWVPDEVWITSIMTYWWESTLDTVLLMKRLFPRARIRVGGIYPTLAPHHLLDALSAQGHHFEIIRGRDLDVGKRKRQTVIRNNDCIVTGGGGPHSSDQERALLRWSLLGLFSS